MSTTVTATKYIHSPGRTTVSQVPHVRVVEMRGWLLASESALAKGWDNPLDAQYDGGDDEEAVAE